MLKLQIYRMKLGKSSYIIRENNMMTEALIKSNKRVTVKQLIWQQKKRKCDVITDTDCCRTTNPGVWNSWTRHTSNTQ